MTISVLVTLRNFNFDYENNDEVGKHVLKRISIMQLFVL
jgi:hypothetical protein